jgi:arylsulfatase A-like enzyme
VSRLASSQTSPARPVLLLAVWFGLVTGFAENAIPLAQRVLLHRWQFPSRDAIWMIPLVDALVFAVVGLVLAILFRFRPRPVNYSIAAGLFAFLSLHLLLSMLPLYRIASLVLAAGFAFQFARMTRLPGSAFERLVRRTTIPLAALVGALAVGMPGWRVLSERRALGRLPAAAPGAPNVLVIVLDAVRARDLSVYGYHRKTTPELERWGKTGVQFDRAFSTSPWTLPSHASMFTGYHPHQMAAGWETPLETEPLTLAEILRARGYATAGFVANTAYCSWQSGLGQGFLHYEDYDVSPVTAVRGASIGSYYYLVHSYLEPRFRESRRLRNITLPHPNQNKVGREINTAFLRWLDKAEPRPFFAFLNFMDGHTPYLPAKGFAGRFRTPDQPGVDYSRAWPEAPKERLTPALLEKKRNEYNDSIAELDSYIGSLLDALKQRGKLDNTLVIITSDHGEEFAEHDLVNHGNSLYAPSVEIPLLLFFPSRIPEARRIAVPVSLIDLAPTILDLVGVEAPPGFAGRTLARHWNGAATLAGTVQDTLIWSVGRVRNQPDWYPASQGDLYALATDSLRYLLNMGSGREELFDFRRDTLEQHDLAQTPEGKLALPAFKKAVDRLLVTKLQNGR